MQPGDRVGLQAEVVTQVELFAPQPGDRVRVMQGTDQGKTGTFTHCRADGRAMVQSAATSNLKSFPLEWLQVVPNATASAASDSDTEALKQPPYASNEDGEPRSGSEARSATGSDIGSDGRAPMLPLESLANGCNPDSVNVLGSPMSEAKPAIASAKPAKKRPFKPWRTVYRYRSKGQMYYRYAWKDLQGKKVLHIAGGNWRSPLVQERQQQVKAWMKEGKPSDWIAAQVERWGF